jgi:hypothetical protein
MSENVENVEDIDNNNDDNNDENVEDNDDNNDVNSNKINVNVENSEECIKQIKKLYITLTLNKQPNKLADILALTSIDQKTFNALGGYEEITASAKLDYTDSIITPNIVKNILKHKEINGTYPTRKDIVQKKIMTDASIRRLFSVIKSKKQIEYITNYCESQINNIAEPEIQDTQPDVPIKLIKKTKKTKKIKKQIDEPIELQ